jgi:hypothetical protein
MLESKSTSKENSLQPHLEAASDLAYRRTQGVRDVKKIWSGTPLSVSAVLRRFPWRQCARMDARDWGATPRSPNGNDGARWPTAPP